MSKLKTGLNASVCLTDSERFSAERPGLKTVLTLERPGTINPLQIFSRTETQRILGLSDRTLDRIEARGEGLPKTQLSPGRDGYRASDLAAWLDQRRMGASLDVRSQPSVPHASASKASNRKPPTRHHHGQFLERRRRAATDGRCSTEAEGDHLRWLRGAS